MATLPWIPSIVLSPSTLSFLRPVLRILGDIMNLAVNSAIRMTHTYIPKLQTQKKQPEGCFFCAKHEGLRSPHAIRRSRETPDGAHALVNGVCVSEWTWVSLRPAHPRR